MSGSGSNVLGDLMKGISGTTGKNSQTGGNQHENSQGDSMNGKHGQSGGNSEGEQMEQSAGRRHKRRHHKKNSWLAHVKTTMKLHRGKSFKQILKIAKKSYKRSQSSQNGGKTLRSKGQRGGSAKTSNFGEDAQAYAK